jgi:S1-C subfamily serine protease
LNPLNKLYTHVQVSGKWVVANWDGTVSGVKGGEQRSFDDLEHTSPATQANTLTAAAARNSKNPNNTNTASIPPKPTKPFARVDAVATGSPAQDAGLKEEDLIVAFGHLHIDNHNHLRAIAEMIPGVAANKESIPITVLRKEEGGSEITKHLDLAPQPWPGRGLIGCHIVPHKI